MLQKIRLWLIQKIAGKDIKVAILDDDPYFANVAIPASYIQCMLEVGQRITLGPKASISGNVDRFMPYINKSYKEEEL